MNGRLALRVGLEKGRSTLLEAHCEFPLQILRPQRAADEWLQLILLTPSGGLLDGDELQAEIVVERGAELELRTQAATQLHSGRSSQTWSMCLHEGASLSYVPHALVPHAGATHRTRLSIAMAGSARLLVAEAVAPGRTHLGELFAYDELCSDLDVLRDGTLVARERQVVQPRASMLCSQLGPYGYFASAYLIGPDAEPFDASTMPITSVVQFGVSELALGGLCMRLLAQRAFDIEEVLAAIRERWRQRSRGGSEPADLTRPLSEAIPARSN